MNNMKTISKLDVGSLKKDVENELLLKKSENRYVKVSDIGAVILDLEKSDLKLPDYNKAIEKICTVLDNTYITIQEEK